MEIKENNEQKKNNEFHYTYSAIEQEELKRIREKYADREESKMERLRRLDRSVTNKAQMAALSAGIIGALILGFGMSLAMTELGNVLGAHSGLSMVVGSVIGVLGCVLVSLAYPLYNRVLKKERKKNAPEVIRLTDDLLK